MDIKIAELLPLATEGTPSKNAIRKALASAYVKDKVATIQMLLYIRDKNNWAGRRDFVRTALLWLKVIDEETFNKVALDFVLVWRWDDLFFCEEIINDHILMIIKNHLNDNDTLLKKWLPKESSDPVVSRIIARGLSLTMKEYRIAIKKWEGSFISTLFRPISSYVVNL